MTLEASEKTVAINGNGVVYSATTTNGNNFGFSNLPYREPIDLQFKDVTYTINMGWTKGKFRFRF